MEKQFVKINSKALSKEKEFSAELDFIVPDVKPDIVAVSETSANTYIYKEELSDGKIRIDGNIDSKVIYISDTGENRSLSVILDFSEILDDNVILKEFRYYSKVELISVEAKILNERKVNVSAKAKITVEFYEEKEIEFISSLSEIKDVEEIKETLKIRNLIGACKTKSTVKEVIELSPEETILDIFKIELNLGDIENKISLNKVLSKSDCLVKITYQSGDMKEKVTENTFQVVSFSDMEKIQKDSMINSRISLRNMQIFLNNESKNKINVNLEYETSIEAFEIKEVSVIEDAYSLSRELSLTKKQYDVALATDSNEEVYKNISILEDVQECDLKQVPEYNMIIYFVKPKDTIWKIAKAFRVSQQSIIDNNNLENPDKINIGDRLYIIR